MKTIIVGSGRSVLDNKNGGKIDTFDTVIRFKGFEDNYHKFYEEAGSKTDIIAFNTNINTIRDLQEKLNNGYLDANFDLDTLFMTYTSKVSFRRGLRILKNWSFEVLTYPPIRKKVSRYVYTKDLSPLRRSLTSGLIVLMHVLMNKQKYGEIYVHGFDSVVRSKNLKGHYYESGNPSFSSHNIDKESNVIQSLIRENKVNLLE